MALNVYKKIMNELNPSRMFEVYNGQDDQRSIAEYDFRTALESGDLESNLPVIANKYTQGRRNVEAELCSDTSRIMKLQKSLNTK